MCPRVFAWDDLSICLPGGLIPVALWSTALMESPIFRVSDYIVESTCRYSVTRQSNARASPTS